MKRKEFAQTLAADICIAVIAVIAYSPGLLNLRPTDESILRAGLSILIAIALMFALVYVHYIRQADRKKASQRRIITADDAEKVFANLESDTFADEIENTQFLLIKMQRIKKAIEKSVSEEFGDSSLSSAKYLGITERAVAAVIENCQGIAKRISAYENYPDDGMKNDVRKMTDSNEEILKKLGKLNSKIIALDDEGDENTVKEIENLIDETEYYRK